MSIAKYELLWIGFILIVTVILFGVLTRFQYGEMQIVLHGSSFGIPAIKIMALAFLWLTLLILGIREYRHKFLRKTPVLILLIDNTLTILATGYCLFALYVASVVGGFMESFMKSNKADEINARLSELNDCIIWIGVVVLTILLVFEIFLITRIRKIKKIKRSVADN